MFQIWICPDAISGSEGNNILMNLWFQIIAKMVTLKSFDNHVVRIFFVVDVVHVVVNPLNLVQLLLKNNVHLNWIVIVINVDHLRVLKFLESNQLIFTNHLKMKNFKLFHSKCFAF